MNILIDKNTDQFPTSSSVALWQSKLSIDASPVKGRLLVASQNFAQGESIIAAPAYPLADSDRKAAQSLEFYKFVFYNPEEYTESEEQPVGYLVFGPMSFCNHSAKPNARVFWKHTQHTSIVLLVAEIEICTGDEITMRYANIDEYPDTKKWTT